MFDEVLSDRREALEESFFARDNATPRERVRVDATKEALAKISGIESDEVLDKLCELGIQADTWAAVSIVPLVEVAWADGKFEDAERRAVLSAADANGIGASSPSHTLLQNWLKQRPDGRLLEVWETFIVGLCSELNSTQRDVLKDQLIGRARSVSEAAGGFLGLGNKTSSEEEAVLAKLTRAFES